MQEALVTLYLRLNGYFTSGFIVHSPILGRSRTEVDALATRFPHNAEPERGVQIADELDGSDEHVDFIIGEVKSRGQKLQFNEGLRAPEPVGSVLRWWGFFTEEEVGALTGPVVNLLAPLPGARSAPTVVGPRGARVRALLFSPERSSRRDSQSWFIPGPPMFAHIWRCFRPPVPRSSCSTTYDFGLWGSELEPIVRYFKDKGRQSAGTFAELLEFLKRET